MTLANDILNASIARSKKESIKQNRKESLMKKRKEAKSKRDIPIIKKLIEKECRKNSASLASGNWVIWASFEYEDVKAAANELDLLVSWHKSEGFGIETDWYREEQQSVYDANVGHGNCD